MVPRPAVVMRREVRAPEPVIRWEALRQVEARVRVPAGDPDYDAVLLLWPDSDDPRTGGEIDVMELQDPARRTAIAAVHHAAGNGQVAGSTAVDATQWHNWAVEWTPTRVTTYVDGVRWFETTDLAAVPAGPMHLCLQLDYFGTDGADRVIPSSMDVDRVRQYPPAPEHV